LERTETRRLNGRLVTEDVCSPVVLRDESETLRVVEPLHCAFGHVTTLLSGEESTSPSSTRAGAQGSCSVAECRLDCNKMICISNDTEEFDRRRNAQFVAGSNGLVRLHEKKRRIEELLAEG
jgi:hypothetical protein